jgi:hypothetical protein
VLKGGAVPSGAAVIRYDGARGVVWRVKYCDAAGKQVMETIGREADGWTKQKAERALGANAGCESRAVARSATSR